RERPLFPPQGPLRATLLQSWFCRWVAPRGVGLWPSAVSCPSRSHAGIPRVPAVPQRGGESVPLNKSQALEWGVDSCTPSAKPFVSDTYGSFDGCNGWNVVDTYSCNAPPCGSAEGFGYPST
ncbi:hypothetical protein T484DRAFT_1878152, partial [Baffinella frigidus]